MVRNLSRTEPDEPDDVQRRIYGRAAHTPSRFDATERDLRTPLVRD